MRLTNTPKYKLYRASSRIGFTSMHANPSDPYEYYFLEVSVVTYKSGECLSEYDFKSRCPKIPNFRL